MPVIKYINSLNTDFINGIATEHTYRGVLANLVKNIVPKIHITNEPRKITDCGNPDFVVTNNQIPIGFIEAKNIGKDLNNKSFNEQFNRYKNALDNLIITDYLTFQFFIRGELINEIKIAEIVGNKIKPLPEKFAEFIELIKSFCGFVYQSIKSPKILAEMMASKAQLLKDIIYNSINLDDQEKNDDSELQGQFLAIKEFLITDLTHKKFADIYAQTLAYGMFAARLHDKTLDSFNRKEAAELIPKSNPFLRKLFNHIAGVDIDKRIIITVDNLAEVFRATDVQKLLKNFGKSTQMDDPLIHFYETFLDKYDPEIKVKLGVWYTPISVVEFIVRNTDEILKTKFNIKDGFADTTKTTITRKSQRINKRKKTNQERDQLLKVHKVQVLDPAVGTGTFLAEIVKFIYNQKFSSMKGAWKAYVHEHLIPRLNGFELMMGPYAIAHLKLDMLLTETGYRPDSNKRFNIFLTDSLEEHHKDTGTLFASWLSDEANEANHVKRDSAVMVIIGNPPYNAKSENKGKWIMDLMKDYKIEPDSNIKLIERNPKWINDDYVKFIRCGQYYIEKNGEGILAFINPHGFLNNPTFRGMRWSLLKAYDEIYTIDLHGNSLRREKCPDGSTDENVFDIQQGVSINFFIKTGEKQTDELGKVFHYNAFGKRQSKYDFLKKNNLDSIPFQELPIRGPDYFFVPRDEELEPLYKNGFDINSLFPKGSTGLVTSKDAFIIDTDLNSLTQRIKYFCNENDIEILNKKFHTFDKKGNPIFWVTPDIKTKVGKFDKNLIKEISYRPFDNQYIYYDHDLLARSRRNLMKHLIDGDNIAFITSRTNKTGGTCDHFFVSNSLVESKCGESSTCCKVFPLYLKTENYEKEPNLNKDITDKISEKINLEFCGAGENSFTPENLLDYIYAMLYSISYRTTYFEFLNADYPRVPYPNNKEEFTSLARLGLEMRELHLFDHQNINGKMSNFPISGTDKITRCIKTDWQMSEDNQLLKIFINDYQYFDEIPLDVWSFKIAGYQPAKKWLESRVNTKLSYDQIIEYQKLIFALSETMRLMEEIDKEVHISIPKEKAMK